jgi:hypothetical protein
MISIWRGKRTSAADFAYGAEMFFDGGIGTIAETIKHLPWSPCVWHGGRRRADHFMLCDYLALDFDDGEMTLDNAVENCFCDINHVIGTTKSHRREKNGFIADRFRVVLALPRRITDAAEYSKIARHYVGIYGSDKACTDTARFFWPCNTIASVVTDADTLEIDEVLAEPAIDASIKKTGNGSTSTLMAAWAVKILREGVSQNANGAVYRVSAHAAERGWSLDSTIAAVLNSTALTGKINDLEEVKRVTANGWKRGRS